MELQMTKTAVRRESSLCVGSVVFVAGLSVVGAMSSVLQAQPFVGVGLLPGGTYSNGNAVSEDGSVVVGGADNSGGDRHAFRWTAAGGIQDLGAVADSRSTEAFAVSADGSVVVGTFYSANGPHAFRWTSSTGIQELPSLPGYPQWAAHGITDDGTLIVGWVAGSEGQFACTWAGPGDPHRLGVLPDQSWSMAWDVSADGSAIVGGSWSGDSHAFRWTRESGMVDLGSLPGAASVYAKRVSADGSVVIGEADDRAFRWSAGAGMQELLAPEGWLYSVVAYGVSGDGSTTVGYGFDASGRSGALLWNSELQPQNLNAYLSSRGIHPTGWTLFEARDISADARVMSGTGLHNDRIEAWVVRLPCPGADVNRDAQVNSQDFFDFLSLFFAADPAADFNHDMVVNSTDFFAFLDVYFNCE